MGKIPHTVSYQYQVLRYRFDVTSGESANIGLVYFDPQTRFLRVRMIKSCDRLVHFFGDISEDFLLQTLTGLEKAFNKLPIESLKKYKSIEQLTRSILPINDNALQFSVLYQGFDFDHESSFIDIYNSYIGRYYKDILVAETHNIENRKMSFQRFMNNERV